MEVNQIKDIYDEISKYTIDLHSDPGSLGPKFLQGQVAQCRNFINNVSQIILKIQREKQEYTRHLRGLEIIFNMKFSDMLANDERVRKLPSIEDRKATTTVFLRSSIEEIDKLKNILSDLDLIEKSVRHTHRELSATMAAIKLQRSLIQTDISTGAMYGDEVPVSNVSKKRAHYDPATAPSIQEAGEDLTESDLSKVFGLDLDSYTTQDSSSSDTTTNEEEEDEGEDEEEEADLIKNDLNPIESFLGVKQSKEEQDFNSDFKDFLSEL
jgi:hypothetical protein